MEVVVQKASMEVSIWTSIDFHGSGDPRRETSASTSMEVRVTSMEAGKLLPWKPKLVDFHGSFNTFMEAALEASVESVTELRS